jgi:hypothetical protein
MLRLLRRLEHKRRTKTRKRTSRSAVGTGGLLAVAFLLLLYPLGFAAAPFLAFIALLAILSLGGAIIGLMLL